MKILLESSVAANPPVKFGSLAIFFWGRNVAQS